MKSKGYSVNNCLEVLRSVKEGFLKENFWTLSIMLAESRACAKA